MPTAFPIIKIYIYSKETTQSHTMLFDFQILNEAWTWKNDHIKTMQTKEVLKDAII